jgi:hypothetical protein
MKALVTSVIIIVVQLLAPVSAHAACTSSKTSGSVKVGSTITNGEVVVCASTGTTFTKSTAKVTTVKKVVSPVKVAPPPPCIVKVPNAAAAYGLHLPGCSVVIVAPASKVATKTTVTTTAINSNLSDQAAFTPDPIGINASPSVGGVGQAFFFSAIASSHKKHGTVLGKPATVSFTLVSFDWNSGGGAGSSFATSWQTEGSHGVGLTATYAVTYSVGAGWIDAGTITSSASASVQVVGSAVAQVTVAPPPLLVSANCRDHPSSYRC